MQWEMITKLGNDLTNHYCLIYENMYSGTHLQ